MLFCSTADCHKDSARDSGFDVFCCVKSSIKFTHPDSKVHGANMGPIWGRQDLGGPYVGLMNLAIWAHLRSLL